MSFVGDGLINYRTIMVPLLVALTGALLCYMPWSVTSVLLAWLGLSVPVGVIVGHCALSEE